MYNKLCPFVFVATDAYCVDKAGLEFLGSTDLPTTWKTEVQTTGSDHSTELNHTSCEGHRS